MFWRCLRNSPRPMKITTLEARIDELTRPPKTPDNSSKPPSQGQKPDVRSPAASAHPARAAPAWDGRWHPNPDHVIDARLTTCPKCEAVFPGRVADPATDLRAHRVAACPAGCDPGAPVRRPLMRLLRRKRVTAEAPPGLEQGSPGRSIAAMLVVYLHYAHAIGMERLATLMDELLGLSISERGNQQHPGSPSRTAA